MRLIDADALLTERKKSKYYHLPNGDIAIPIIDVEHAPTVKPKPQWIPCAHENDLISRQAAIDALHMHLMYRMGTDSNKKRLDEWINNLPSAQPEEVIPVSWIESRIERLMMAGDAFTGLMASTIRVMLNEWKREKEGGTDGSD